MKASQFAQPTGASQDKMLVSTMKNLGYDMQRMRTAMSDSMKNGGGNL
jgi:Holliday junction resolvasome RuvABC DNA-binding subunit